MNDLNKEDYTDPVCPFCTTAFEPQPERVNIRRIREKLDELFAKKEFSRAEQTLNYWIGEAERGGDTTGLFHLCNEQMGFYRKQGDGERAKQAARQALDLCQRLDYSDTVSGATCFINAATVYKAFGEPERAMELYRKAEIVYAAKTEPDDPRRGGLYNNMALAAAELNRFDEARSCYETALHIMQTQPDGQGECAVTLLNLADLAQAEFNAAASEDWEGLERTVHPLLDRAWDSLNDSAFPTDGNTAYFLEKCAPVFGYYGQFYRKNLLEKRAAELTQSFQNKN